MAISTPRIARRKTATGIGLALIHVGGCLAFVPAFFSWPAVFTAIVLYYLTGGIGVCLGYHRMLTHRGLRMARPIEYAIAFLGVLALQGGPIAWVGTHRAHHAFSDTERDPHDSRRGFWWSHAAWLYRPNTARLSEAEESRYAPELAGDPTYRFLDRTAVVWQVVLGVALYVAGGWPFVIWGIFARLVVLYHATWLVNSAAHLFGYRRFRAPGRDRSTNNWLVALISWGEGWHNNHHAFPFSARHGMQWFEFDITWVTIKLLAFAGIVTEIRTPDAAALRRRALESARYENEPAYLSSKAQPVAPNVSRERA